MIRLISLLHRRSDIDHAEFRRYWNAPEFDELIGRMIVFGGAERSDKSLALQVEATEILRAMRGSAEPFDGVIEYYWSNAAKISQKLAAIRERPEEFDLGKAMRDYQSQFVDIDRSCQFFTSE